MSDLPKEIKEKMNAYRKKWDTTYNLNNPTFEIGDLVLWRSSPGERFGVIKSIIPPHKAKVLWLDKNEPLVVYLSEIKKVMGE